MKGDKPVRRNIKRIAFFCGVVAFMMLGAGLVFEKELPDKYNVVEGKSLVFPDGLPVVATAEDSVAAGSNLRAGLQYKSDLRLFGVIQIKSVNVNVVKTSYAVPGGEVFGVKLYTEGVMVIGMTDVDTATGPHNPAYDAGIRKGDILIAIDGKSVNSNAEVGSAFTQSGGKELTVSVKRGATGFEVKVKPAFSDSEKAYKAGMWVRDSTAGIGTVTYYNPDNGVFGGLGHAVCDVDTGEILPLLSGEAVKADLNNIVKGSKGRTGELEGTLEDTPVGSLLLNNQTGVFGVLSGSVPTQKSIPVAMCQQVHAGAATIVSTIDDSGPHSYSVKIESVNYDDKAPTKNMTIRITDPTLISKTGGIVQGMSGSPIIQDGYLVGALTHVFVSDPLRGYGIFAENMQNTAKTLEIMYKSDVS
jgi:stage IV sporulation protein B